MQVQVRSLNYTLYIFLLDELFFYVEKVWNLKHKKLLHSKQMQENKKLENLVKLFGMQEVNSRTRGGGSTTTDLCPSRNLPIFSPTPAMTRPDF